MWGAEKDRGIEVDEEEDEDEDETDGSDEDVWGVAVSIFSPEEVEDCEGNKNNMSPCLQNTKEKKLGN